MSHSEHTTPCKILQLLQPCVLNLDFGQIFYSKSYDQLCKYVSMQVCKYACMQVFTYAHMQVCTYMQVC